MTGNQVVSTMFDFSTCIRIRLDCTLVPWESLTSMVISLALVNGFYQWPVIKWFLPCSTSTPVITWLDSYFGWWGWRHWILSLWSRLRWSMYYLRHVDPMCMFRGYVVLIKKFVVQIHSVFQWLCYDWHDYMDPQCMIGGHDFCLWRHPSMIWVWECLPQNWYMYDTLLMLGVYRSPSRCAFGSWHTHTAYKVFRLSLVPLSDFGGHFVIHIFGYRDDDMIMTWWWKI